MTLLNLDNTLNKYLEIINKQILEPYLIKINYQDPGDTNANTNSIFSKIKTSGSDTINSANFPIKYAAGSNDGILKIKQDATNFYAEFTQSANIKILDESSEVINLSVDSDGIIYYNTTTSKTIYDLSSFDSANLNTMSLSTTLTNHTYLDYLIRFKLLNYIKNNHITSKTTNLKDSIISSITDIINADINGKKCQEMLDFLQFINNNNFDKFKATVDCLYYYYYLALLEYNIEFCKNNFTEYNTTKFSSDGNSGYNSIKDIGENSEKTNINITFTGNIGTADVANKKITNILILILECLLCANSKNGSIVKDNVGKIFETASNSKLKTLITYLAKLCNIANDGVGIKSSSDGSTSSEKIATTADTVSQHFLVLNYANNSGTNYSINDTMYTNITDCLTCQQLLFNLIGQNILDKSVEIKEIKKISKFINDLYQESEKPFLNAINHDIFTSKVLQTTNALTSAFIPNTENSFQGTKDSVSINYIDLIDVNIKNMNTELGKIIEHYDKAEKLNNIQSTIQTKLNHINSIVSDTTNDNNDKINKNLTAITKYDKFYKENVDKYKIKNTELDNIVKNNLYNNIFLYITILVLVLICLGIIFINNHKQSLKTQYSILIIAFLLLYYIIYTNITINVTENFVQQSITIHNLSLNVYTYLVNLAGSSQNYKASLDKEKNKYSSFAKSSNAKLNNLELILNDEFINAIKSKELVKFLILFTLISIISYIVYVNVDDLTTTSIIFLILLVIILCIYFYNINLVTRTKHSNKYWNHQMSMKK